jgi:hypothetical protein
MTFEGLQKTLRNDSCIGARTHSRLLSLRIFKIIPRHLFSSLTMIKALQTILIVENLQMAFISTLESKYDIDRVCIMVLYLFFIEIQPKNVV